MLCRVIKIRFRNIMRSMSYTHVEDAPFILGIANSLHRHSHIFFLLMFGHME
jgi:hypothetical protein